METYNLPSNLGILNFLGNQCVYIFTHQVLAIYSLNQFRSITYSFAIPHYPFRTNLVRQSCETTIQSIIIISALLKMFNPTWSNIVSHSLASIRCQSITRLKTLSLTQARTPFARELASFFFIYVIYTISKFTNCAPHSLLLHSLHYTYKHI